MAHILKRVHIHAISHTTTYVRCGTFLHYQTQLSTNYYSNPAEAYSFQFKFVFEKNENKQKEAGVGTFF